LEAVNNRRSPCADLRERIRVAVRDVIRRQVECGVDIVNDGEASKLSYATYVKERLDGFNGDAPPAPPPPDFEEFPEYMYGKMRGAERRRSACDGPLRYRGLDAVRADLNNLAAALDDPAAESASGAFMTAASPGVIAHFLPNQYYGSEEAYLWALADAMKVEYDEIHSAGFVLQLDCPDLAAGRYRHGEDLERFRRSATLSIEALSYATRDIPPEDLRLHLCWGNDEAPHRRDVPLADILDIVLRSRPATISFEAANPRHAHEWTVFAEVELPDDKRIIPGVIDSTTNYVEHPDLVAQRLVQYAKLVGRERVLAGSDCGFATVAGSTLVHPTVAWAKIVTLAEGARLASDRLWRKVRA
jgi:5-methyltetrahydropteroyltriglutamate--homocysteine methyltransferase